MKYQITVKRGALSNDAAAANDSADLQSRLANTSYLHLFQIKAIANMLNEHPLMTRPDVDEDVAGGILAILQIAERGIEDLEER